MNILKGIYLQTIIALPLLLSILSCSKKETDDPIVDQPSIDYPTYIKACDLSFLPEMRQDGVVYRNLNNQAEDPLETLRKAGMNAVRLRLWNQHNGASGLKAVESIANEITEKKIMTWITLHYSDTWADPGNQQKPEAWKNLSFEVLKDSVYEFTFKVAKALQPGILQIGNEINQGLLWPEGQRPNIYQMRALLAEGIRACRNASPNTKIMLHHAGYQNAVTFFDQLQNLDYDLIGISYYPIWHGKSLSELSNAIRLLSDSYAKDVIIAETSYPFTFDWADYTNNIIGSPNQTISAFPASPEGQLNFLNELSFQVDSAGGKGWCYWGAEWVASKGPEAGNGSSWENQALWDFDFQALPAQNAFVRAVAK